MLLHCWLGSDEDLIPCNLVFEPIEATSLKDLVVFSRFALWVQIFQEGMGQEGGREAGGGEEGPLQSPCAGAGSVARRVCIYCVALM